MTVSAREAAERVLAMPAVPKMAFADDFARAVLGVLDIHKPRPLITSVAMGEPVGDDLVCESCTEGMWPCATAAAIDLALRSGAFS